MSNQLCFFFQFSLRTNIIIAFLLFDVYFNNKKQCFLNFYAFKIMYRKMWETWQHRMHIQHGEALQLTSHQLTESVKARPPLLLEVAMVKVKLAMLFFFKFLLRIKTILLLFYLMGILIKRKQCYLNFYALYLDLATLYAHWTLFAANFMSVNGNLKPALPFPFLFHLSYTVLVQCIYYKYLYKNLLLLFCKVNFCILVQTQHLLLFT